MDSSTGKKWCPLSALNQGHLEAECVQWAVKKEDVRSVVRTLTRLPQSKSEKTTMQPTKHIIYLLDQEGSIVGVLSLPSTALLTSLQSFRSFGICRIEVQ